jgi:UDP-N-acetylglucosamine:LPS N-acetylglucosamine transferase
MIARRGAGILLKKATDIIPMIQSLLGDSKKYADMKAATLSLSAPNSTEIIIREIAALLPSNTQTSKAPLPVTV